MRDKNVQHRSAFGSDNQRSHPQLLVYSTLDTKPMSCGYYGKQILIEIA
jgi:hypothetical protein